jgi:hypothetical protein
MVRCALGLIAALFAIGACDNGKNHLHPEAGRDAPPPPWWQPELGTVKDWDIQLVDPIDVSATRTMYLLDLWSLVPSAQMLDYGDGMPVTVPIGTNPGTIAELHARGVKVICHVDTGVLDLTAPDAMKFPGYEAMPPDDPDPPASGSVIGWTVDPLTPDVRFLDLNAAGRAMWTKYMFERFDLAKTIGCDGVDAASNEIGITATGFTTLNAADQFSWYDDIAKELHDRELSAGMHNGSTISDLIDHGSEEFDWLLIERCGEDDCSTTRPFIEKRRVVFAVDYETNFDGDPNNEDGLCQRQQQAQISEGLVKDFPPSKNKRRQCQE